MEERFKMIASAYLFFKRGNEVLLARRANTGYEDGNYGLVAGHVEAHESLTRAACREAAEESGVRIDPKHIKLVLTMHRRSNDERLDFFFEPQTWEGEPTNMEPDRCDDVRWFPLDALPANTIPYIKHALECYQRGIPYTEVGW